jgi:hypothetical protein
MARNEQEEIVKGGPANHAADTELDAPTPPGGPLRQDRPDADVHPMPEPEPMPGSEPGPDPDPDVEPSSTPEGPATIPSPSTPDGEPGPDPDRGTQLENAETSLDQPSDGVA